MNQVKRVKQISWSKSLVKKFMKDFDS